jgi:hypothetical protein
MYADHTAMVRLVPAERRSFGSSLLEERFRGLVSTGTSLFHCFVAAAIGKSYHRRSCARPRGGLHGESPDVRPVCQERNHRYVTRKRCFPLSEVGSVFDPDDICSGC